VPVPSFTIKSRINAPIDLVFDVLTDHRGYKRFVPLRAVKLEREGEPPPNGVGAIRALHAVGPPIREQVTEYVAPTRFAYRMLSGAPVRDHVGAIDLAADGDGTLMTYHVESFPKLPRFMVPVLMMVLRGVIGQMARGIGKTAEKLAGSPA
jgi:uncharacterized protein YndB with AHSA1/START domain